MKGEALDIRDVVVMIPNTEYPAPLFNMVKAEISRYWLHQRGLVKAHTKFDVQVYRIDPAAHKYYLRCPFRENLDHRHLLKLPIEVWNFCNTPRLRYVIDISHGQCPECGNVIARVSPTVRVFSESVEESV